MNHLQNAIANTLMIGSSSLMGIISMGDDELVKEYSGEDLVRKRVEYRNALAEVRGWDLALYIVLNSKDDEHRVLILEKSFNELDTNHFAEVYQVILRELGRFKDPDAEVLSYNWVCAPKTIDFGKQEEEILKWFEKHGSFSKDHQDNTTTILKLAENLNVSPLTL